MKILSYAEIYTPDHPLASMYAAGHKKTAGHLLRDLLQASGGRYEVSAELSDGLRDSVLHVAESTNDSKLAAIATANSVPISLEHLRGLDPDKTRIVYGLRLVKELTDGHLEGIEP